jgi:Zn-dependent peptidase ImmA (M78 family)
MTPRKMGSKVPGKQIVQIRNEANCIRNALGIKKEKINMISVIEFILPTLLPDYSYEIQSKVKMGIDEARTYPDKQLVYIREDVYQAVTDGDRRAQFTLAHELGHLVMHSGLKESQSFARNSVQHHIFEDSEWQADTFAAEFLMPYEIARTCANPQEIFDKFGVSKFAAEIRYRKIK